MGGNKLKKLFISTLMLGFFFLIPSINTYANQFNTAQDLIGAGVPEQKLYNGNDGNVYFWQAGTTKTPGYEYYTIIGMEVEATNGANTYSGVLGSMRFIRFDTIVGNQTFSLFTVDQNLIVNALWEGGADINDLLFMYCKPYELELNCLVTSVSGGGTPRGSVHPYSGTYVSGSVYTDSGAKYQTGFTTKVGTMPGWMEGIRTEIANLWDVRLRVNINAKFPVSSESHIPQKSWDSRTIKAHYDEGEIRWVNTKDPFCVFGIVRSEGNGIDHKSAFKGADGGRLNLYRFEGTDYGNHRSTTTASFAKTASSIGLNVSDNFTLETTGEVTIGSDLPHPNPIYTNVNLKANKTSDGSSYILSSQGLMSRKGVVALSEEVYSRNASGTYQILKVDGNPPYTANGAKDLSVSVKGVTMALSVSNIKDMKANSTTISGSGLNTSTVYAIVTRDGVDVKVPITYSSDKGTAEINLITSFDDPFDGVYTIKFYATDNVGNEGLLGTKTETISNSGPRTTSVAIDPKSVEYTNASTKTHWVRPENEFRIDVQGKKVGSYPTAVNLRLTSSFNLSDLENLYISHNMGKIDNKNVTIRESGNGDSRFIYRSKTLAQENDNFIRTTDASDFTVEGRQYLKAKASAHGMYFYPWGLSEFTKGAKYYAGSWKSEDTLYRVGVDGKAPTMDTISYARDSEVISIFDLHSGVKSWEVTTEDADGNTVNYISGNGSNSENIKIDLTGAVRYIVMATDNVDNYFEYTFDRGKVSTKISAKESIVSGKKILTFSYEADNAEAVPELLPAYGKSEVVGVNQTASKERLMSFKDETIVVNDIYNNPSGPGLLFSTDQINFARFDYAKISDISYKYIGKISTKLKGESSFVLGDSLTQTFCSGENSYKITVDKLKEFKGGVTKDPYNKILTRSKNDPTMINMNDMPPGQYKATITMYDFNNNASGTTTITFNFPGLYKLEPGNFEVTEVKDVSWIQESYPKVYSASTFPLGLNTLNRLGMSIKQGYAINYRISLPFTDVDRLDSAAITYRFVDTSNNSELELFDFEDKSLRTYHDSRVESPTKFYSKVNDFKYKDNYLYMQHYVPANVKYKKVSGGNYYKPQKVTVYVKSKYVVNLIVHEVEIPLYHYYTSETALDDLEGKIQR